MLQWLHISILILFTSLSLVTDNSLMMGSAQASNWRTDHSSKLAGAVLAPVSVIFIIYALFTYLWRAQRIARREPSARCVQRRSSSRILTQCHPRAGMTTVLGPPCWSCCFCR